jgi:hypothetical protein
MVAATTLTVSFMTFAALPAHAIEPIVSDPLATSAVSAFVVDGAHSHLLFGSGSAQNGVLVTDLSGVTVATVPTAGGVDDISMSPDGLYAYAASSAVNEIYRITLATLAVTAYATPAADCPVSVAAVNGTYVAFAFTCDAQWGGVAVLNTANGTVNPGSSNAFYDPWIRLVHGTTQVVVVDRGDSLSNAGEYQTSTGSPVLSHDTRAFDYGLANCPYLHDMTVSPDGSSMLTACGGNPVLREYRVSDFTASATYPAGTSVTAAAYSPDGAYIGAGMNGDYDNDLAVFTSDTSLFYALDYGEDYSGDSGPSTAPHGVAFSSDSSQFYTLASNDPDDPGKVWLVTLPATTVPTFPPPPPPPVTTPPVTTPVSTPVSSPTRAAAPVASTTTVASPARQFVGQQFALTGTVAFADGSSAAGVLVVISRTVAGVTTGVGQTTTNAHGGYSFAVTPNALGAIAYHVGFPGDVHHYGSQAASTTSIVRAPAQISLKVAKLKGKVYVVTAHLASWGVNRHVLISANKKIIGNGVVNTKGLLSVHFTRKKATAFMVVFTGDKNDYPARAFATLR